MNSGPIANKTGDLNDAIGNSNDAASLPDAISIEKWGNQHVAMGQTCNLAVKFAESYSGRKLQLPVQIRRAPSDGPTVFISAGLHGDEINGTGAIRHLIQSGLLDSLKCGNLILVPVLNLLGYERHSRYLPDRRDLNRCFPGSATGSLSSRIADKIFTELVGRSNYGIDFHTAAIRRTNYPSVRGDLSIGEVERIAMAFGCEIIMDGTGPSGSFRNEACRVGCPTIVIEGGEIWKFEPTIVELMAMGALNVLKELGMIDGEINLPSQQFICETSKWIRAEKGGLLQFHVSPGDTVQKEQLIATNTSLLGETRSQLHAPYHGVVVGMTTLPSIAPGDPVCHIAKFHKGIRPETVTKTRAKDDGLEDRIIDDLATNVFVEQPPLDAIKNDSSDVK